MENPIKIDDLGVPLFLETPIFVYCMSCGHVDNTGQDDCNLASPSPSLTGPPHCRCLQLQLKEAFITRILSTLSLPMRMFFLKKHVSIFNEQLCHTWPTWSFANSVGCEFMVSSCSPPQLVDSN